MESKARLLEELDEARDYLWGELASIGDHTEISPGMTKIKILAHIAGWESLVFAALREHIYGIPAAPHPYDGVDALNHEFLLIRRGATAASARLECEINRFAIGALLTLVSDEDLDSPVTFPWGEETVAQFLQGAIKHERDHADEIAEHRRKSRT